MGEFTIQCTVCDASFGSETEYNNHGCTADDNDVKLPFKIKLEPQDDDEDQEMENALLDFSASEFNEEEITNIKCEPFEMMDMKDEVIENLSKDSSDMIDPLSLKMEKEEEQSLPDEVEDTNSQVQDRILNETETFTENYTHDAGQEEIITGEKSKNRPPISSLKNYSCNCKICGAVFSKKEEFSKHFREDHKTYRPYECGICGKKFLHKHYVNLHMRVHTGEKPYACKLCPRSYSHKTSYTIHMRIHNGERPYECGVCGKKCYDKSGLTSHMRSHTKETPYQCEVCGRRFTHSKSLLVHRRNHTGEKPYICSYCGKAFRHWHKHKIHVRLHTGERPYKCKVCGKGFPRNDEVSRHMRSHQGIKSFKCSICGIYCATQASITGHINLHHANLKTEEMEPPPEKTLVKNSTSGILGSKVPEPRSIYRIKFNGFVSPSTSKSVDKKVARQTQSKEPKNKPVSTRVIEVTSKDTPITIPSSSKKSLSKKHNCILPKPQTSSEETENKTMNYQEFLNWQERMLTNQGLIVKGYSSSGTESIPPKPNSSPIANQPSLSKEVTKTASTAGVSKPQYLLLSQGGEGNVTKILLPFNMIDSNAASKKSVSTPITLASPSVATPTVVASGASGSAQGNRPLLLLPHSMPSQSLLIVSNGGQRMLLMPSANENRSNAQSIAAASNVLSIKQEPKEIDQAVPTEFAIKTEAPSPPQSPKLLDIPPMRIKQEVD
ncbi:UNVERIFIED_CONTAM: hypothetical protein GTU68_042316 [Idotea baltica]|nr:hypothetical protein [Idotea baltica]